MKCKKCDKSHAGKCIQPIRKLSNGRWFFVNEGCLDCKSCNGKFGGGSTSRPGGSGLLGHLQQRKNTCGREWEKEYWKDTVNKWSDWDEEFQIGLVIKWIELYWKKKQDCNICGKEYKDVAGMRRHTSAKKLPCALLHPVRSVRRTLQALIT